MSTHILRLAAVKYQTGLARSTIYHRIRHGLWPKPVSLGPRAVGWPADEVATLNVARIAGKTDEEIRAMVARIELGRKTAGGPHA